jgi:hypothetical protein
MKEFLFKLFRLEYDQPHCESCETLKLLLEAERRDKNRLLDAILADKDREREPEIKVAPQPIMPKHLPWAVVKQQLEEKDRMQAEQTRKDQQARNTVITNANSVEDLERELGVVNDEAS